jgi:hypothetical protein
MNDNDKNSIWDELNIQKRGLNVKKALMITDSNQALFGKKSSCRLQEVLNTEVGGAWKAKL